MRYSLANVEVKDALIMVILIEDSGRRNNQYGEASRSIPQGFEYHKGRTGGSLFHNRIMAILLEILRTKLIYVVNEIILFVEILRQDTYVFVRYVLICMKNGIAFILL